MASIEMKGLESYMSRLESLNKNITGTLKRGVYDAADVVADAVRASISALPSAADIEGLVAYAKKRPAVLTQSQKSGLLSGLYLAKMRTAGGRVDTKLTFTGYNSTKTKSYPQGQPNAMIAAAVESGSSARRKQPFMRPTANRVKGQAVEAMRQTIDADIKKIMEG